MIARFHTVHAYSCWFSTVWFFFLFLIEVHTFPSSETAPPLPTPAPIPGTERADIGRFVLHDCLLLTAASANPVTSGSTSLRQEGNIFLMSLPLVPLKLKGRGKYPHQLWFWVMLKSTTKRQRLGRRWAHHPWACGSADVITQLGGRKRYGSRSPRGNWIKQLRLTTLAFHRVAFPGTF